MANITEFKSRLSGGGARANQFKVMLTFPDIATTAGGEDNPGVSGTSLMDDMSFLCNGTTIPDQTIGVTPVKFRGRELKLAGDSRAFKDWEITVINDTDFKIYRAFEKWLNAINNMTDNTGVINTSLYQSTGTIHQLDRNGATLKKWKFIGCFPHTLGTIELGFETENEIEDFSVTLSYQWFETDTST